MSSTTGKMTIQEAAMKHGSKGLIPADDPIYQNGWVIGATVPYKVRPTGSASTGFYVKQHFMLERIKVN